MIENRAAYGVAEQYKTSTNLEARISLHERFSTNPYGWHRWVFDHFDLPDQARILELGCGVGRLWLENLDRIPSGWDVTLSDFSEGMLQQTQQNLAQTGRRFTFQVINVTDEDALLDYILSSSAVFNLPIERREELTKFVRERFAAAGGVFTITKDAGIICGWHDNSS